jgi:hypothetical protein
MGGVGAGIFGKEKPLGERCGGWGTLNPRGVEGRWQISTDTPPPECGSSFLSCSGLMLFDSAPCQGIEPSKTSFGGSSAPSAQGLSEEVI